MASNPANTTPHLPKTDGRGRATATAKLGSPEGRTLSNVTGDAGSAGENNHDIGGEHQLGGGAFLRHGVFAPVRELTGELAEDHISLYLGNRIALRSRYDGRAREIELRAGDISVGPAGLRYAVSWSKPAEFLTLVGTRAMFSKAARELGTRGSFEFQAINLRDPHIEWILRNLHKDLAEGNPTGPLYSELLLAALAVRAIKSLGTIAAEPRIYRKGLASSTLRQLTSYLDEHLDQPISLTDLAARADISPHYFCQLFKQSTGQSPHQYLLQRRIEQAKRLLRDTRLTLAEVAYRTGFSSQAHFTGTFRRFVGLTPGAYRTRK